MKITLYSMLLCIALVTAAWAGKADVIEATVTYTGDNTFSFSATIQHADEGWKHYADRWEVLSPDGEVLGTRVLLHPHEQEQPFTRSLSGVKIPAAIQSVAIRAHDSTHGWGGKTKTLTLPARN